MLCSDEKAKNDFQALFLLVWVWKPNNKVLSFTLLSFNKIKLFEMGFYVNGIGKDVRIAQNES